MLNKLKEKIKERRLWKDYIATNKVAKLLGELVGARPYFMSFEEYKKQRAEEEEQCSSVDGKYLYTDWEDDAYAVEVWSTPSGRHKYYKLVKKEK